ncbi:MAG: hypothetical protein GY796_33905 [Chloroflexi bacterium]|nr:hypothetical protein [Chloroflexota bacterium]
MKNITDVVGGVKRIVRHLLTIPGRLYLVDRQAARVFKFCFVYSDFTDL